MKIVLGNMDKKIADLEAELEQIRPQAAQCRAVVDGFNKSNVLIKEQEDKIKELEQRIKEQEDNIKELEQRIKGQAKTIRTYSKRIDDLSDSIGTLSSERDEDLYKINQLQQDKKCLKAENDRLVGDLATVSGTHGSEFSDLKIGHVLTVAGVQRRFVISEIRTEFRGVSPDRGFPTGAQLLARLFMEGHEV